VLAFYVYVHIVAPSTIQPIYPRRETTMPRLIQPLPVVSVAIALSSFAAQARNAPRQIQFSDAAIVQFGVNANSLVANSSTSNQTYK
jgi:hypothetical protein